MDPRTINKVDFRAQGGGGLNLNPLAVIPPGVKPPPIPLVALLPTLPLLANGIANYFMVPLSIAIGRRPMLLFAGVCAWAGGLWAGLSPSLAQHLAARSIQGLGAGAMEALIPLVVQDIVFLHQRNRAMSTVISSQVGPLHLSRPSDTSLCYLLLLFKCNFLLTPFPQGVVIIGLGIAAPYVAANYDWRWLYFITSGFGVLAWILMIALVPETRWIRSKEELSMGCPFPPPRIVLLLTLVPSQAANLLKCSGMTRTGP